MELGTSGPVASEMVWWFGMCRVPLPVRAIPPVRTADASAVRPALPRQHDRRNLVGDRTSYYRRSLPEKVPEIFANHFLPQFGPSEWGRAAFCSRGWVSPEPASDQRSDTAHAAMHPDSASWCRPVSQPHCSNGCLGRSIIQISDMHIGRIRSVKKDLDSIRR